MGAIGIQQTPWVDFDEGIYRYRFQGTTFAERLPLLTTMTSADAGVSFHYNLPSNYGDFHVGLYNGENYQRVELNNDKAFEFRGSIRPFATQKPVLRGIRAHLVYYNDAYVASDVRERTMGNVTFEHPYINAEFDYLNAKDKTLAVDLATADQLAPRVPADRLVVAESGIESPADIARLRRAGAVAFLVGAIAERSEQNRWIYGVAHWFPHQGAVTTAIMLDYDGQQFNNIVTAPVHAVTLHGLINF